MKTVGSYEAKTKFASLLDRVERGEEVAISRRGRVVARLVPAVSRDREAIQRAIDGIRMLRRGKHATVEEIREWIKEGRT